MRNRVFFSQSALDEWLATDRVDLQNDELSLRSAGRRYRIIEAVHITREVTGSPDAHEVVGKVKSKAFLAELGAEVLEGSMILGENAYDVSPGFVGAPIGSFVDYLRGNLGQPFATDEDLLLMFGAGAD